MPRKPRPQETLLRRRLTDRTSATEGGTTQEIAAGAGVSTRTIKDVLGGRYALDPLPSADPKACTTKQLRGYVQALSRLAVHLGLDAREVVREYGIDPQWPGVAAAIDQVQRRSIVHSGISDPILDRIAARSPMTLQPEIIRWPPFSRAADPGSWWAWRYLRRLLGALNPSWPATMPRGITGIERAIGDALRQPGPSGDSPDLVFGLYDTSFRRVRGLQFVHLPGLGVPLAMLSLTGQREVTWEGVAGASGSASDVVAVVLDGEAGHLFLTGVCHFPEDRLRVIRESEQQSDAIASRVAYEFAVTMGAPQRTVFVADSLTCEMVYSKFREPGRPLTSSLLLARQDLLGTFDTIVDAIQFLAADAAPVFRLGSAVRADAPRWRDLLEQATIDLFRTAPILMAHDYALLLREPGAWNLRPLPLAPTLDLPQSARFARAVGRAYRDLHPEKKGLHELKGWRDWSDTWTGTNTREPAQERVESLCRALHVELTTDRVAAIENMTTQALHERAACLELNRSWDLPPTHTR